MTSYSSPGRPTPAVVVLLTTWNRPHLLQQSLPQIEREARQIRAPLVIADDQSDDARTLQILAHAQARGLTVIRRPYKRQPNPMTGPNAWKYAHFHIQWNNLFAFRYVLDHYPSIDRVLKVDDDIVLTTGAFASMLDAWERATCDGRDVLALSGLATINEPIVEQCDGYAITSSACAAAILYRRSDWESFVARVPDEQIVGYGFDVAFRDFYGPVHRPGARLVSVTPSVVYHTGMYGTHEAVHHRDINVNYAGSLDDVIVG